VAFWDYDGDGWLDIFLVGQLGATSTGGGLLYHNRGDGTFEDRTAGSGLGLPGYWMGCAVGDYDNDGKPDLLLTGYGARRLFHNLGQGRFADVTSASGVGVTSSVEWSTAAGFADLNRDGRLDLVVGRYVLFTQKIAESEAGRWWTPERFRAQKPSVFINQGGGVFQDETEAYGLTGSSGKTLGLAFTDLNGDGYPDIYLANDTAACDLFLSRSGGKYVNRGLASGTAYNFNGGVQAGMGADWGDFNGDGKPDLVVTTFEREPTSLYLNDDDGYFKHVSFSAGIAEPTLPYVAWGTRLFDYDLDGQMDLVVVTGHVRPDAVASADRGGFAQPPLLFRGTGDGRLTLVPGQPLGADMVARGLSVGDFDNDGKPDLLIGALLGTPRLFRNTTHGGHWLGVRVLGKQSNRLALGAKVTIRAGGRTQMREVSTAGSYLSAQDPRLIFGLGTAPLADFVDITWPSGAHHRWEQVAPDRYYTYVEPDGSADRH
jgi:hypothetical protein